MFPISNNIIVNMKIVEFIPSLRAAGAERLVVDLSNEFADSTSVSEVSVVTLYKPSSDESLRCFLNPIIKTYSLNKSVGFSLMTYWRFYRLLKLLRPDVVHAHTVAINYLLLAMLLMPKVKFYITFHNDANFEATSKVAMLLRKIYLRLRPNIAVTISEHSQMTFRNVYKKASTLIYNGAPNILPVKMNLTRYRLTPETRLFINVARIMPAKRQLFIAEAFTQLIDEGYDIAIMFIGDEKDKIISEKLKEYSNDRIFVLGQKDNPRDYMFSCDCFTLGSEYEGMPITLIEAFSIGCIPICTPAGGCANMISNMKNGILASDLSLESYCEAIKQYLSLDQSQIQQMKVACVDTFEKKYKISTCCQKYLDLFNS